MPRKTPDLDFDFNIYVDPSCLSDPMTDETPITEPMATEQPPVEQSSPVSDDIVEGDASPVEEVEEPADPALVETESALDADLPAEEQTQQLEESQQDLPVPEEPTTDDSPAAGFDQTPEASTEVEPVAEPEPTSELEQVTEPGPSSIGEPTSEDSINEPEPEQSETAVEDSNEPDVEEQAAPALEKEPVEPDTEVDEDQVVEPEPVEPEAVAEDDQSLEEANMDTKEPDHDNIPLQEQLTQPNEELPAEELSTEELPTDEFPTEELPTKELHDEDLGGQDVNQEEQFDEEDAQTPRPSHILNTNNEEGQDRSYPPPTQSDRKTSLRTEALIQAAARAVVAKIEKRHSSQPSVTEDNEEADRSILSTGTQEMYAPGETQDSYDEELSDCRRGSSESQVHHTLASRSASGDEGGDSSSHHGAEDDVFSDRSARSSLGSYDGANDLTIKSPPLVDDQDHRSSFRSSGRSPRMSSVSMMSDLSQYDKEHFIPTSRDTRLPFRTPSAVRAIQMNSPTPSVFNGASPRSGKRQHGSSAGMPSISRLGSPVVSAQYSPKGRSTPTRLKSRKDAPLVLLHVTLLQLRWMWGDVLNGLDAVDGKYLEKSQQTFEASEQLKTLRDAWRELQDCVGDTVLERGVLLPHPQNDYEVLEERLLEALELPLRRRARILECGHYLGPANEEDDESEDEYASQDGRAREEKRHWCSTCKGEIRFEDLGPGRVFRVKVYASNGLMKAGAWAACWKEMERVDIEVEPLVEPCVQGELERLAAAQLELEERVIREDEQRLRDEEQKMRDEEQRLRDEDQRLRDEDQRIREDELRLREEELRLREAESAPKPARGRELFPIPEDRQLIESEEVVPLVEEPTLPVTVEPERSFTEAEVMLPSTSSAMQIAMHASPMQPPSNPVATRAPLAASAHTALAVRPEPIDVSEERRRRDEERLREIYGETAPPVDSPPETTFSMQVRPTSRLQHPEPFIPPPTPRSPSEEAYERRERRNSHGGAVHQRQNYENASFIELFLEAFKVFTEKLLDAFKVLLRDPKNIAIGVLMAIVWLILVRPAALPTPVTFGNNDHVAYRYDAKAEVNVNTPPVVRIETAAVESTASQLPEVVAVVPAVVHEVEVTVEASSVVVLAGLVPKVAVSNILLDVSTVSAVLEATMSSPSVEAPTEVSEPDALAAGYMEEESFSLEVEEETLVDEVITITDSAKDFASHEADAPMSSVLSDARIFDFPICPLNPVAEVSPSDESEESVPEYQQQEATIASEEGISASVDDLEYSGSIDELDGPDISEDSSLFEGEETPDSVDGMDISISDNVSEAQGMEFCQEPSIPVMEEAAMSVMPDIAEASFREAASATPTAESSATSASESAQATHPCESYLRSVKLNATGATHGPAPSSVSRAAAVIEKKTVRVFETITETVRVSITATETASAVETAVPQTYEETVFETETVRVTVSVPVSSPPTASEISEFEGCLNYKPAFVDEQVSRDEL
ncbi:hypothetical protein B0T17DRAFT_2706 [Bombardia bombarda]|uniref:Pathway-specific nitrogen regulator n=1 Tax=Bombardia bombarda TaxID=252184 RepID=A0AA39XJS0_9PEZI|nr:hypothetical protein B0T17DRAFT_2706 [Bombardia bombarda]